ncbi:MAG: RsmB/NOP family class I SAM-dependent RNA methyltransferase [Sphingosinicella sp.]|nr:RsmB/NOP family class I SAM-dependent RNA methyltransferase [Sphingosinicella sp.]
MMPAARVQAAIELLDDIIAAARDAGPAADTIIARYFKTRRYAGSKDRRAVRELVYRAIRRSGERPASGRTAMLGVTQEEESLLALFDGTPHGPAPVQDGEAAVDASAAPSWLVQRFDLLLDAAEFDALLYRATLDVRINRLKGRREEAQAALAEATLTPLSPIGLRLPVGFAVDEHPLHHSGLIEVQDEGSQLLSLASGVEPGMTVIDLCAGAGGKTLALAAEMGNRGRIIALDTDRNRLSRLAPRAERAGATIIEQRLLNPGAEMDVIADLRATADMVLVDAPCSGTGTWRRNPESRWRLDPKRLSRLVNLQAHLLGLAAELVRPGGHLVYAVCSLLTEEGRGQADTFEASRSGMVSETLPIPGGREAGSGRLLTPGHDGTDGFFVARWRVP